MIFAVVLLILAAQSQLTVQNPLCPDGFPNLRVHTADSHGDLCRNALMHTFGVGWACPLNCEHSNDNKYCINTGSSDPCRAEAASNAITDCHDFSGCWEWESGWVFDQPFTITQTGCAGEIISPGSPQPAAITVVGGVMSVTADPNLVSNPGVDMDGRITWTSGRMPYVPKACHTAEWAPWSDWSPACSTVRERVCNGDGCAGPAYEIKASTETPTSRPTTSRPTTSMPTTSMPTTSMPTTSMPTTSMPTTSMPTTSMPTTSMPTTSMPTTMPTMQPTDQPDQCPIVAGCDTDVAGFPSHTRGNDDVLVTVDCDGDGKLDQVCYNLAADRVWLILSSEGCPSNWGGAMWAGKRPKSHCPTMDWAQAGFRRLL